MGISLPAVVCVVLAVVCYAEAFDQRWALHRAYRTVENRNRTVYIHKDSNECTVAGLQCTSCYRLTLCVATSSGLVEFYTEYCDSNQGEYCSASLKECSGRKSYCSLNTRFECQDEGAFPDPFDCNQYYVCSSSPYGGISAEKVVCPAGTVFNVKTLQCDLPESNAICNGYPVPECPESGLASGALAQNPNLYYICKDGLPYLFKCIEGDDYVYNPDLYICVKNDSTTTTTPETTVAPTTTEAPEPESCIPGVVHPIPETCGRVFLCTNMPNPPEIWKCGANFTNSYLDRETRMCTNGPCPYQNDWKRVCPDNTKNRPVPLTCNMYYDCSYTAETDLGAVKQCEVGYFDREQGICLRKTCPYTF